MAEFSLIHNHFKHATTCHEHTILGIGDDCAISDIPPQQQLVSCIDTLVAGRHFPEHTSPYAIGWKSVAVNLSDLAAMAATPYAILLALSLPDADDAWLTEFSRGLRECCEHYGVELIGGDTTKSPILTISVTALGFVPQGQAILRSGAKVGDVICVSGEIGNASLALQQILNGQSTPLQSALDMPVPQVALGQKLRTFAHAILDISDGLAQDLGHILTASGVGAILDLDKIPTHTMLQALAPHERWQYQLNGGDDYELCLTMSKQKFAEFNQLYPNQIFAIGEVIAEQGLHLFDHQQKVDFHVNGWQHF
ncbi:MAG: thiamine-phosphate kinase [Acinetobacter sp.]|nr:thiamine-phosphate kinase [Acinetobacter sp.]